ncbi:hypothetical protein DCCM_2007 [Desulfocucumis palustris]|uniref:Uncharacterized protein n=1 Tax=Desulfocucumis palustris TaxID=1898651 RepID=A0A2L2XA18_9FIRM|nr:hypothetical protein DCCM_2007 [Desulfocucumis palustris]
MTPLFYSILLTPDTTEHNIRPSKQKNGLNGNHPGHRQQTGRFGSIKQSSYRKAATHTAKVAVQGVFFAIA